MLIYFTYFLFKTRGLLQERQLLEVPPSHSKQFSLHSEHCPD